ncbi:hypothetical protein FRB95_014463 [Tulasnella sp. JGI-2019a]|nr:hypothetical protein FRB95_014463 [Tulasnella sp. JGI-2019a]
MSGCKPSSTLASISCEDLVVKEFYSTSTTGTGDRCYLCLPSDTAHTSVVGEAVLSMWSNTLMRMVYSHINQILHCTIPPESLTVPRLQFVLVALAKSSEGNVQHYVKS